MPVIVDEVVISVEVSNQAAGGSAAPSSATDEKQTVISECIERVLGIFWSKKRGADLSDDRGTLEKKCLSRHTTSRIISGEPIGQFESFVNPNEITLAYEMEYDAAQGSGATSSRMNFKKMKPAATSR